MKGNFTLLTFVMVAVTTCLCMVAGATKKRIKPTKIECKSLDEKYVHIRHCNLKENNGETEAFVHIELQAHNITNLTYNVEFFQKNPLNNKYVPILMNLTGNVCDVLKNDDRKDLTKLLYNSLIEGTNLNHECPINHDIILENYILKDDFLRYLPVPPGDFLVQVQVGINNDWKLKCKGYGSLLPKIF